MSSSAKQRKRSEATRRTWKGYISSPNRMELGQIVFIGPVRAVVREEFTREAWEAERVLPPRDPADEGDRTFGKFTGSFARPGPIPEFDGTRVNPPGYDYFYGIDYI